MPHPTHAFLLLMLNPRVDTKEDYDNDPPPPRHFQRGQRICRQIEVASDARMQ